MEGHLGPVRTLDQTVFAGDGNPLETLRFHRVWGQAYRIQFCGGMRVRESKTL